MYATVKKKIILGIIRIDYNKVILFSNSTISIKILIKKNIILMENIRVLSLVHVSSPSVLIRIKYDYIRTYLR